MAIPTRHDRERARRVRGMCAAHGVDPEPYLDSGFEPAAVRAALDAGRRLTCRACQADLCQPPQDDGLCASCRCAVLFVVVAEYAGSRVAWAWGSTVDEALSGGDQQAGADMEGMTEEHVMTLTGPRAVHARAWLESAGDPSGRIDLMEAHVDGRADA